MDKAALDKRRREVDRTGVSWAREAAGAAKEHEIAAVTGKAGLGVVQGASEVLFMGWQKEKVGPWNNLDKVAYKERAAGGMRLV